MERQANPHCTPDFFLWCSPKARPAVVVPTLSHSLVILDTLKSNPHLISKWHPLSHIFRNPLFPPGMNIKAFSWWLNKGMYRIGHFIHPTGPLTRTYCISKLDMPPEEHYRLRQLRNFLHKLWSSTPNPLTLTEYELWCGQATEQRGGPSVIYRSLAKMDFKTLFKGTWDNPGAWLPGKGHHSLQLRQFLIRHSQRRI